MTDLPTSVQEIIEYASEGYTVLTTPDGRTIGCKVTSATLQDAEAIVAGWYMAYSNRQWVVSDFINQCAVKFGEAAHQIIPMDSLLLPNASSTLSNWCSVVAQYELHERLYPLSFSHYAAVAYVEDRNERESLLEWAVDNQASVARLTAEKNSRVAMQAGRGDDLQPPTDETIHVYSSDEISGILAGNIKPLIRLFATWRERVKTGKRYKLMLVEVE